MTKSSIYQRGRKCSSCGRHLESGDGYTMKLDPRGKETVLCVDCDQYTFIPQKPYYKEE